MEKYELVKEEIVEEYGAKIMMFRHKKTGAEIMSVAAPDENKCFGKFCLMYPPHPGSNLDVLPSCVRLSLLTMATCSYRYHFPYTAQRFDWHPSHPGTQCAVWIAQVPCQGALR